MFIKYIIEFHFHDCLKIISSEDNLGYYSIKVDFLKLVEIYPAVGDKVLYSPLKFLPECNRDVIKAQERILKRKLYRPWTSRLAYSFLKLNVQARFFGLPVCPELHRTLFPKNSDVGCFLKISGTAIRITQSKMLEYKRKYVCVKCQHENIVEADFESSYILKMPTKCINPKQNCKCTVFSQFNLLSRIDCKDYQEIKVQEQVSKLKIGTIPGYMIVVLENDLVDACKPGDDVIICGTVRRRWRPCKQTQRTRVELIFDANYVEVSNAKRCDVISTSPDIKECFNEFWTTYEHLPLKGRDEILKTVCPQMFGLHLIKLGLLLTVITAANHDVDSKGKKTSKDDDFASHVREQCHLLLVGDPGTGKSQLLRAAEDLTPRSVFTTGSGSSLAGLTCLAKKEDGVWHLEAGALVLSDGGVCCIDEITHLNEFDKMAMHEAMEQQTISVAKVGIVRKLNTRCAVIAACNPRGRYRTDEPVSANVSLGTPLLSRFDLVFILLDSKNKSWDELVSNHLLYPREGSAEFKNKWTVDRLQTYIELIGPRCVRRTRSANAILQNYYTMQRKSESRDPSRTTVRMLNSLIRLSEAHCRLMYRTTMLALDAIAAISLIDLSMKNCMIHDKPDALHTTFNKYPDFEYLCTAKKLLYKLNLCDVWQEELLYYAKLLDVDHKTLESEIQNKNPISFMKFNTQCDENISLSVIPVRSSYFDDLKRKYSTENIRNVNTEELEVAPCDELECSEPKKPKRKEVTIINDTMQKKNKKKSKTAKTESARKNISYESSTENIDINNMLNEVPSVNDAYKGLGIHIKSESDKENIVAQDSQSQNTIKQCSTNIDKNIKDKESEPNNKLKLESVPDTRNESDKTKHLIKLKQFEYKENRDLSKFQHSSSTYLKQTNEDNSNVCKPSASSSQISMFESSDCDIDLELN